MVHTGPHLRHRAKEMRRAPTRGEDRLLGLAARPAIRWYKFRRQSLQQRRIALLRIPNELLIRDSLMVEQRIRFAIESRR